MMLGLTALPLPAGLRTHCAPWSGRHLCFYTEIQPCEHWNANSLLVLVRSLSALCICHIACVLCQYHTYMSPKALSVSSICVFDTGSSREVLASVRMAESCWVSPCTCIRRFLTTMLVSLPLESTVCKIVTARPYASWCVFCISSSADTALTSSAVTNSALSLIIDSRRL